MNQLYALTWICIYIYIPDVSSGVKLPEDVVKCRFGDSACIVRSINALIKAYPQGNPEIGLPRLDVLRFPDCSVLDSPYRGPIWLNFRMWDNVCSGFNNITVTQVEGFLRQPNRRRIVLKAHLPRLLHESAYHEEGRILLMTINTTSRLQSDFQNFRATLSMKVIEEYRNNRRYLKIYSMEPNIELDRWISWRQDLFRENSDVTIAVNRILNENWVEYWNELQPGMAKAFTTALTTLLNRVFQNVPYDDMFLPDLDIRSNFSGP